MADNRFVGNHDPAFPNVVQALPGSVVSQESRRVWDDVEAMRFRPASEEMSAPALSKHLIVMHLGPPLEITQISGGGRASRRLVGPGDAAVVPAGVASQWRWGQGEKDRADSLHLYLAPALIRDAAKGVGVDPDRAELIGGFVSRERQIEQIALSFLPELEVEDPLGSGLFAEALARALAVHLLREHSTLGWRGRRVSSRKLEGGLSKRALRRATDYVGDNLAGSLTLSEISRAANISPYHFSRLFKESTGLSPHQYVIRERVERAKELLRSTDLPLHEVAALAGFADQSHMGRHLKRLLGVSPTRLRRR